MTEIKLATRIEKMKPSATLAMSAKAALLKAQGRDIINLSVGEPDFDTPEHVKDAAIAALQAGFTKYTPVDGIPDLKQAIITKLAKDNGLHYEAKEIIVSTGAKQAIYNLLQVLINPGDEVIIPAPYWVSYPEMVELADGKPITISTTMQQQLKINAQQLAQAVTPKTRLLILNSPSNPTGLIYSAEELKALADVLLKHPHVFIMTDDIYEHIRWNNKPFSNIVDVCPELKDRTIVINGVSKVYSMTGWRIGYAAGPQKIIKAMTDLQSQCTSNANSIAQKAAAAALKGDQACVQVMVNAFAKRQQMVFERLQAMPGVSVLSAEGAFYSFPNFAPIIKALPNVQNDIELAEYLLDKAGIALVPGTPFGAPDHLRLSFALNDKLLAEALNRLEQAIRI